MFPNYLCNHFGPHSNCPLLTLFRKTPHAKKVEIRCKVQSGFALPGGRNPRIQKHVVNWAKFPERFSRDFTEFSSRTPDEIPETATAFYRNLQMSTSFLHCFFGFFLRWNFPFSLCKLGRNRPQSRRKLPKLQAENYA